ncbi:unnamed protein product [Ectocarpus sp. CCAP 1310/34]|nr:unnamed protein product [Ectocarpus sp. CCAP 1310/34]
MFETTICTTPNPYHDRTAPHRSAPQFEQNVSAEKIQAARGLADGLKRVDAPGPSAAAVGGPGPAASLSSMSALVSALERLAEAYIDPAMVGGTAVNTTKFHDKKTGGITFAEAVPKGKPTLDRCLRDRGSGLAAGSRGRGSSESSGGGRVMSGVVTRPPAVRADADYRRTPTIAGFQNSFSITDSMRVVFATVNTFLREDPAARKRRLRVFTHTIVPLSPNSGVLEWVEDTMPYGSYLTDRDSGRAGAHRRYFPKDWDARSMVFATVNTFLREDPAARKRRLRVFTHTIVPLSPNSGVLEWVEDTMPYGSYLTDRDSGRAGAHRRYFPKDWLHAKCRTHLKNAVDKRKGYKEVEDNFHPAFRFFFLENFPEPFAWYNSRLTFTRSAAVSSIVGYVLGIGDRHAHNILVHQRTAEVVHIDFGVTFEQGKALSTPETVPFRLTRDVVDGMGVTGTEGAFRRACDAAMRVLRSDAPSVLTILEEEKAGGGGAAAEAAAAAMVAVAGDDAGVGGDAAQRALARIKHKLQGYVDPNGDAMSVEGQVKLLINQARDPENLCKLYVGWAPWL